MRIPLTVWRDGKSVDLKVPLEKQPNVVIRGLNGTYPRYFVHGPLVFMPAYQELFSALGARGTAYLLANRNPILQRWGEKPKSPDEELVVCRVLTHSLTKGYDNLVFATIESVNNHDVKNLDDLVIAIRDNDEEFLALEFSGNNETLVFRSDDLADATEDVQDEEGIRVRGSEDVLKLWDDGHMTEDDG